MANRLTLTQRFVRSCYCYPLHGTGPTHRFAYKLFLGLHDTWIMRWVRKTLIQSYIAEAGTIRAYRELYGGLLNPSFGDLPITNKMNFHIGFQNVKDRVPDGTSDEHIGSLEIMKTSGSTTGIPSEIPVSTTDVTNLCNYYQNVSLVSDGIFPSSYWYINMFPITNSSTGIMSELLVPERYRLGRSNVDPNVTFNLFANSLTKNKITDTGPIVLGGLPILHMEFLKYLEEKEDDPAKKNLIVTTMKQRGICLYGGESPTIPEKLELHKYYSRIVGIYGSTELGPKLGFSIEPNLVIDLALQIPEILKAVTGQDSATPCTFFYDPYINHYEIVNGSLVNTPLIQQEELKIRWDQDDYCALAKPEDVVTILRNNRDQLTARLSEIDNRYNVDLAGILNEMLDGKEYDRLLSYYGMLIFYGRKGVVYGGSNLDNAFMEKVHEELQDQLKFMAISRFESDDDKVGLTVDKYSGLRLDILVEPHGEHDGDQLKSKILETMKRKHHDFEQIIGFYEANDRMDEVNDNLHLWVFDEGESPMHDIFEKSQKRNYILKKVGDEYKQTAAKY